MWFIMVHLCCSCAYICGAAFTDTPPAPELYMTANGVVIPEGQHDYRSPEGEPTNFTCHGNDNVYITYQRNRSEEVVYASPLSTWDAHVYMKLSARANDSLLACFLGIYLTNMVQLRLIVEPRDNDTDIIGFTVNGLITSGVSSARGLQHQYSYFSGEQLVVEVTGGAGAAVSCRFEGTNVPNNLTADNIAKYLTPHHNVFKIILYKDQSDLFLKCTALRLADAVLYHSSIKFILYNDPAYDPYIAGLSFARILMQYNSRGVNTVIYEYMGNDALTLSLISDNVHWQYDPNDVVTACRPPTADRGTIALQLHPHVDRTTVQYPSEVSRASIMFIRTEEANAPAAAAVADLAELISAEKRKLGYAYSGAAAAVVGAVLAALMALKFLGKRKSMQATSDDIAMDEIEHRHKRAREQAAVTHPAEPGSIAEQRDD